MTYIVDGSDEILALKLKWSGGQVNLLPLPSGAWAGWNYERELRIWPGYPSEHELREFSESGRQARLGLQDDVDRRVKEIRLATPSSRQVEQSMEELGL